MQLVEHALVGCATESIPSPSGACDANDFSVHPRERQLAVTHSVL